jgi:hypothetical protein
MSLNTMRTARGMCNRDSSWSDVRGFLLAHGLTEHRAHVFYIYRNIPRYGKDVPF